MVEVYTPPPPPPPPPSYPPPSGAYGAPSPAVAELKRNLWWTVAAAGIALLLLARLIHLFDTLEGRDDAAQNVFAALGHIVLVVGLTLAALLQPAMHWGVRAALLIAAAFLAASSGPVWL